MAKKIQTLESWLDIPTNSDFSIYNLPFGIFSTKEKSPRIGIAIGTEIIDMLALNKAGLLKQFNIPNSVFENNFLNDFITLGKKTTNAVRTTVQQLLLKGNSTLQKKKNIFVAQKNAQMHLPIKVGDYTDFYSSIEHATNVGIMFRGKENALMPNWKHMPIGYHGRASSIIPSGQNIYRPMGQMLPKDKTEPVYGASKALDMELEMAFVIGKESKLGQRISTKQAQDYIFGMVLFNDWSARDIQRWEYVPLGPFLGKNFASSISLWVVTLEALEFYKTQGPKHDTKLLPYLQSSNHQNIDIQLQVALTPNKGKENIICNSNYKYMYWNMSQQLAHHTVNGCNVKVGDMMASGTISGPDENSYGSMLELAWMGTKPLQLHDGSTRVYFQDGDTVTMRAWCEKNNIRVGFGEVTTKILPVKK